jgi:hypothetical protein
MKKFPAEFSELLLPKGLRILHDESAADRGVLAGSNQRFATFSNLIRRESAAACMQLLDEHLYQSLYVEQGSIPPESITMMEENYSETLSKTMHIKTAFFRRKSARAYVAARKIGLLTMMRSKSFVEFAEVVSGLKLDPNYTIQVSCYEQGDYVGPHNDHHPEEDQMRDGFVDFHVMFTNKAVQHQYLVYEHRGHFSKIVDINIQGGISIYRLPFWHYTTPLAAKPGREGEARRWLLLATFPILKD